MTRLSLKNLLALIAFKLILPAFTISPQTITIKAFLNQNVTLNCTFDEAVTCAWLRNDSYIIIINRYSLINGEEESKMCDLHIRNVSTIDNANWTCKSTDDARFYKNQSRIIWNVIVTAEPNPTTTAKHDATQQTTTKTTTIASKQTELLPKLSNKKIQTEPEKFPTAIVVASAASGGLLALIFGITIFACYRCKKGESRVVPTPIFIQNPNDDKVRYANTDYSRHSNTPCSVISTEYEFCDVFGPNVKSPVRNPRVFKKNRPESHISDDSHFYHEIVDDPL